MVISIRSDDLPCLAHGLMASLPPKEKGTPSCPAYRVVRGFFSVVVQIGFVFPSKQLLMTVQQFVLLCPHDLPCIITITNIEKTLV